MGVRDKILHIKKEILNLPEKGDVFWYKKKGCIYACIVLDTVCSEYFLIGISQQLTDIPTDVQTVLDAPLYTAAWFDELSVLKSKFRHEIGRIDIEGNYFNRCGLLIDEEGIVHTNVGQSSTWKHDFREFSISMSNMSVLLDVKRFPKMHR